MARVNDITQRMWYLVTLCLFALLNFRSVVETPLDSARFLLLSDLPRSPLKSLAPSQTPAKEVEPQRKVKVSGVSVDPSLEEKKSKAGGELTPIVKEVQEAMNRSFRSSQAVRAMISRENHIDMLSETTKEEGVLTFSQGRLRLEIQKPEKSLLVFNSPTLWIENHLPKEFGSGVQVTKINITGSRKKREALLALFFDDMDIWGEFRLEKKEQRKGLSTYVLATPGFTNINRVIVSVAEGKMGVVKKIEYFDHLDNRTSYYFSKIDELKEVADDLFIYDPPKEGYTEL